MIIREDGITKPRNRPDFPVMGRLRHDQGNQALAAGLQDQPAAILDGGAEQQARRDEFTQKTCDRGGIFMDAGDLPVGVIRPHQVAPDIGAFEYEPLQSVTGHPFTP